MAAPPAPAPAAPAAAAPAAAAAAAASQRQARRLAAALSCGDAPALARALLRGGGCGGAGLGALRSTAWAALLLLHVPSSSSSSSAASSSGGGDGALGDADGPDAFFASVVASAAAAGGGGGGGGGDYCPQQEQSQQHDFEGRLDARLELLRAEYGGVVAREWLAVAAPPPAVAGAADPAALPTGGSRLRQQQQRLAGGGGGAEQAELQPPPPLTASRAGWAGGRLSDKQDAALRAQLQADLPRTIPFGRRHARLFAADPRLRAALERVLYCWSRRHGYFQGLGDVAAVVLLVVLGQLVDLDEDDDSDAAAFDDGEDAAVATAKTPYTTTETRRRRQARGAAPFAGGESDDDDDDDDEEEALSSSSSASSGGRVVVLNTVQLQRVEADTFWLLSRFLAPVAGLMTDVRDGMETMTKALRDALLSREQDVGLVAHLDSLQLEELHYSVRWLLCLLSRDLPFAAVARLFDAYIAAEFLAPGVLPDLHAHVCAELVRSFREELLAADSFGDAISLLQNLPTATAGADFGSTLVANALDLFVTHGVTAPSGSNSSLQHTRATQLRAALAAASSADDDDDDDE